MLHPEYYPPQCAYSQNTLNDANTAISHQSSLISFITHPNFIASSCPTIEQIYTHDCQMNINIYSVYLHRNKLTHLQSTLRKYLRAS